MSAAGHTRHVAMAARGDGLSVLGDTSRAVRVVGVLVAGVHAVRRALPWPVRGRTIEGEDPVALAVRHAARLDDVASTEPTSSPRRRAAANTGARAGLPEEDLILVSVSHRNLARVAPDNVIMVADERRPHPRE